MARNQSYNGSIDLISGIRPKNNGTFALVDAHDIQVAQDGERLDAALEKIGKNVGLSIVNGQVCLTYEEE